MAQIVVRQIDDVVLNRIKARARANHRSAEAEVRELLTDAVRPRKPKRKSLTSLVGAAESGRSPKDIEDYIRGLREEWDR